MGIVLGYLCLLSFCSLAARAFSHKLKFKKTKNILAAIHKPACLAFIVIGTMHVISVLPVLKTRHMYLLITGIAAIISMLLLIILCHTITQDKHLNLLVHRILTVIISICIIGHMIMYFIDYRNYQRIIQETTIEDVDTSHIQDGTYSGEYDAGYIYAKVAVTVKNDQISNINLLEHHNERGIPAEKIIEDIVNKQKVNVDAVSGATNSSLVIEKAVENALNSNPITHFH